MIDPTSLILLRAQQAALGLQQLNAVSLRTSEPPFDLQAASRAAALSTASVGESLLLRIAFWSGVAETRIGRLIAAPFLDRLADRLNLISDEIERWVAA